MLTRRFFIGGVVSSGITGWPALAQAGAAATIPAKDENDCRPDRAEVPRGQSGGWLPRDWLSVTLPIHSVFGAEPRKVALETGKVAPNVTSAMSDEEELDEIQEAIKIGLARFEYKKGAKVIP